MGYQGYKASRDNGDMRKVSNSSTESDSCFGSYTEESRSMGEITERIIRIISKISVTCRRECLHKSVQQ